ncbi:hypothetical protein FHG87_006754 [Trinorchestia longiramus]|nr:hypothetical protein FHG87_006754 [Trinorchestia longiramus]
MAKQSSVSLNLPLTSDGIDRLTPSAVEPSRSLKKRKDFGDDDCRRSRRFRSKVLNFWDFERIAVLNTEEGTKAAVIKDVPGEGTIILQDENCTGDKKSDSISVVPQKIFSQSRPSKETRSSQSNSQPKSSNENAASRADQKKYLNSSEQLFFDKSVPMNTAELDARPNIASKLRNKSRSNESADEKQSPGMTPAKSRPPSSSGAVPRRTPRPKFKSPDGEELKDQLPAKKPDKNSSHESENSEPTVSSPTQQSASSVSARGRLEKKMIYKCSSKGSLKSLSSAVASVNVLKDQNMNSEDVPDFQSLKVSSPKLVSPDVSQKSQNLASLPSSEVGSSLAESRQLPMKTDPENELLRSEQTRACIRPKTSSNSSVASCDHPFNVSSDALGSQAAQENSDDPVTAADDVLNRSSDVFIMGKDLVFHGLSKSSNSAAATGTYAFAKGGTHDAVEIFFLHLQKGCINFNAPKDMKVFVVRGCGNCSQVVRGAPIVINVLFQGAEINVQKGATLRVSVDHDCDELILCLMLYDSTL